MPLICGQNSAAKPFTLKVGHRVAPDAPRLIRPEVPDVHVKFRPPPLRTSARRRHRHRPRECQPVPVRRSRFQPRRLTRPCEIAAVTKALASGTARRSLRRSTTPLWGYPRIPAQSGSTMRDRTAATAPHPTYQPAPARVPINPTALILGRAHTEGSKDLSNRASRRFSSSGTAKQDPFGGPSDFQTDRLEPMRLLPPHIPLRFRHLTGEPCIVTGSNQEPRRSTLTSSTKRN